MNFFRNMKLMLIDSASIAVAHGGTMERTPDHTMIFSDSTERDWHLLRLYSLALRNVMVEVEVRIRPCPTCNTDFYFNAMGGVDVAVVSAQGKLKDRGISRALEIDTNEDGSMTIHVLYHSRDGCATFGTHQKSGVYVGSGQPQFIIESLLIYTREAPWLDCVDPAKQIILVDVGAAGGIQEKWLPFRNFLKCIFFEPDANEAANLRIADSVHGVDQVIEAALFNVDGESTLHLTRFAQCSSLLKPRVETLANYKVGPCFEILRSQVVSVRRFDSLWREGLVPSPDVLKIDVQGAEKQVLEGFGNQLDRCLAIELETHFYQIYEGQPLIGDIISYLKAFGLFLRRIEPQMSFDRDLVEVNAYFTRHRNSLSTMEDRKLQIVEQAWGLKEESSVGTLLTINYA